MIWVSEISAAQGFHPSWQDQGTQLCEKPINGFRTWMSCFTGVAFHRNTSCGHIELVQLRFKMIRISR